MRILSLDFDATYGMIVASLATALCWPACACADGLADLEGRVEIDGSSTVAPLTINVAHLFGDECPKVIVPVAISGTGGGFKRFTRGDTDISNASRPITKEELNQCAANGVKFVELPVAYDGLTVVCSRDNTWVDYLTVQELTAIFGDESPARTWSDVRAGWPAVEIRIYAPGTDSGTFDYFQGVVAASGALRDDMSASEDDNQLVTGVAQSKGGIGFFGAAYFFANADKLKAIPIANPRTGNPITPTVETISNGSYVPFARPLFIYVNAQSAKRPEVRHFIDFYLQRAADLATSVGYLGLPPEIYDAARRTISEQRTGTHFLESEGGSGQATLAELYVDGNLVE